MPAGRYTEISDLLRILEALWNNYLKKEDELQILIQTDKNGITKKTFDFHPKQMKVNILSPKYHYRHVFFTFSEKLCQALGFNKKHLDKQIGNELMKCVHDTTPDEVLKDSF